MEIKFIIFKTSKPEITKLSLNRLKVLVKKGEWVYKIKEMNNGTKKAFRLCYDQFILHDFLWIEVNHKTYLTKTEK